MSVVFDELCWLEPGIETLLIDLLFDDVQNLLPGVHLDNFNKQRNSFPQ